VHKNEKKRKCIRMKLILNNVKSLTMICHAETEVLRGGKEGDKYGEDR
jgi:hypothetical protein